MFTEEIIQEVWSNAKEVLNENPNEVRMDKCGARILRKEYGNTNSKFGWQIDHIIPVSKGGTDDITNLQALQWENNEAKGDGPLRCKITFKDNHYVVIPHWDIIFE